MFLQLWPDGPSAYLGPADAVPVKRELAAAFGCETADVVIDGEVRATSALTLPRHSVEPYHSRE